MKASELRSRSQAERNFELAWKMSRRPGGEDLAREYVFHPTRKWRFDFAFPSAKLAVEIDGRARGNPNTPGRHQTVDGVRKDCEKNNEAVRLGWRVLRFPATDRELALDWVLLVKEILGAP